MLALVPIVVKLAKMSGFGSVNIAVSFLQANSVIMQMELQWPPALERFFNSMSVVSINFEFFSIECLIPSWNPLNKMMFVNFLPVAFVPVLVGYAYLLKALKKKRTAPGAELVSYSTYSSSSATAFILILSWGYITLSNANLEFFNCDENQDGTYTLVVDPRWRLMSHSAFLPVSLLCSSAMLVH